MRVHSESLVFLCCALVAVVTVARCDYPYLELSDWHTSPVWTFEKSEGRRADAVPPPGLWRDLLRTGATGPILASLGGLAVIGLAVRRRRATVILRRLALLATVVGASGAAKSLAFLLGPMAGSGYGFGEVYLPRTEGLGAVRLGFGLAAVLLSTALLFEAIPRRETRP